jgi:hypothetical protein
MRMKIRRVLSFFHAEKAQDAFEYLLIIGGVSVAVILGVTVAAPSLMDEVIYGTCNAVDTVMPVSCTDPSP